MEKKWAGAWWQWCMVAVVGSEWEVSRERLERGGRWDGW